MEGLKALERELRPAEAFVAVAALGWALSSDTLALVGCLGALAVGSLHLWQRYCLAGVRYVRRLERHRAGFGEVVGLELEIVNDKPLPLSFLEIDDEVPGVPIEGGSVASGFGRGRTLVQVLPLLPYQRVRRRLTVRCDRRGAHRFGPATLTSGDPVGWRTRSEVAATTEELLVYPKVLQIVPEGIVSRMLLGDQRARAELLADPSRVAGVRAYQAGDPLRHVNWRATARAGELLVRRFEPTVSPRVAVFLDVFVPRAASWGSEPDELEFVVAAGASLVSALAGRDVPVGLFTTGSVVGRPVAHRPSGAAAALPAMLESLARLVPMGTLLLERVLLSATARMAGPTSLLVVAADFSPSLLASIGEVRRRHPVSAVHLAMPGGRQPPRGRVDALLRTAYVDDWKDRSALELSP